MPAILPPKHTAAYTAANSAGTMHVHPTPHRVCHPPKKTQPLNTTPRNMGIPGLKLITCPLNPQLSHDELTGETGQKFGNLLERMSAFEAFLAALPTWKADILEKLEGTSLEMRSRTDKLASRADASEKEIKSNHQ
eukprot:363353-Chlamydomonas_euryale.AAC.1